jgi:hypothetical protein
MIENVPKINVRDQTTDPRDSERAGRVNQEVREPA